MAEKRSVDDIVKEGEVGTVRGETPLERICRLFIENVPEVGAFLIIGFGMIVAVIAMIVSDALRSVAFQLIVAAVSGALGFLFGSKRRRD